MVQIQLVPIKIFSQVSFYLFIHVYYKATTLLQDTFTYFNYFFLFRIPCGFSVYLEKKSREFPHCECTIYLVSWMDFSSIHITTCTLTLCAILLLLFSTFHLDKLFICVQIGLKYIQDIKMIKGSNPNVIFKSSYEKRLFIIFFCSF